MLNITSIFPTGTHLYQAIPRGDRAVTRYTYAQAYTPMAKVLDTSAFHDRPLLLTLLLRKDYVREHLEFKNIHNSTAKLLEYYQIREAIILKLSRSNHWVSVYYFFYGPFVLAAASLVKKADNPSLIFQ